MGKKRARVVPRNPVVQMATVLRKGGAHTKSRKAIRLAEKLKWKREINRTGDLPSSFVGAA
ncbi:MAG: hypothetical protein EP335_02195 [Alphaproteobacteria bacterium]|nr:MAG: hypothetical protein EP335_02195 [Alphaproteobacteria bacterium]